MRTRVLFDFAAALALLAAGSILACASSAEAEEAAAPAAAAAEKPAEPGYTDPEVPALPWDAEKMTELTANLAKEMRGVRNAFRQSPNYQNDRMPNQRAAAKLYQTLKNLDQSCASLAARVKKGENADQTRGLALSIGELLNNVDEDSRKLPSQDWTMEKARAAMETLNEIAPYYGRGPLYDVQNMTKLDRGPNPNRRPDDDGKDGDQNSGD